jgi:hypothetical protein
VDIENWRLHSSSSNISSDEESSRCPSRCSARSTADGRGFPTVLAYSKYPSLEDEDDSSRDADDSGTESDRWRGGVVFFECCIKR